MSDFFLVLAIQFGSVLVAVIVGGALARGSPLKRAGVAILCGALVYLVFHWWIGHWIWTKMHSKPTSIRLSLDPIDATTRQACAASWEIDPARIARAG